MKNLGKSSSRLTSQPARRAVVTIEDTAVLPSTDALVSELLSQPKFLQELWKEWLVGTVGKKAAKDFPFAKRGKVKSKYSFQK